MDDGRRQKFENRSSNRSFGLVMSAASAILGLLPLLYRKPPYPWFLASAGIFLLAALLVPAALAPLNSLWFKLGLLLHKVTGPLLLGGVFYLVITPMGLLRRLFGSDPMGRRFEPDRASYWQARTPPGPRPEDLKNQF